jgi:putative chitinase
MTTLNPLKLLEIAPKAITQYRTAFERSNGTLVDFGILNNRNRLAHFLAQCLHETAGLLLRAENMNYRAERLMEVWPNRFPNLEDARPYANNPEALANLVYGGRMGNSEPGDGWRYIGRGLLQLTGRKNYQDVGAKLGLTLTAIPEMASSSQHCLSIAGAYWEMNGLNQLADKDDIVAVTRRLNGGTHGLNSRKIWLNKVRKFIEVEHVEPIQ